MANAKAKQGSTLLSDWKHTAMTDHGTQHDRAGEHTAKAEKATHCAKGLG
jgi:hypothetical protein